MSSPTVEVTTVDLLRHGSCQGGEIYRGRTDVPLNADGWSQMERAVGVPTNWECVVTSPLLRCREFAEHLATRFKLPMQVEAALSEMDFGEWDGRLLEDVWRDDPELVSRFYEDPASVTPPGGESVVDAQRRVLTAWRALVRQRSGQKILMICHGGVIRLLLSDLLDLPLSSIARLHIPYGSLSRVQLHHREEGDFPVLLSLNSGMMV